MIKSKPSPSLRRSPRQVAIDCLPAKVSMWLRAQKNQSELFGLHAPAATLADLVPPGCVAIDAGAARGLYTYWIAEYAREVWAFEPNPHAHALLARSVRNNVRTVNVALSDGFGTAVLTIPPAGDGEASLEPRERKGSTLVEVNLRTLDSYRLENVGFMKIDVEGHEMALLRGAEETLRRCRPTVFIELVEAHRAGAVSEGIAYFATELGYTDLSFMVRGQFRPIAEFDQAAHQSNVPFTSSPDFVSNFLFRP